MASAWDNFTGNFGAGIGQDLIDYYKQRVADIKSSRSTFGPDYGLFGENFYVDDPSGRFRMVAQEGFSEPFKDEYGREMVYDKNGNVRPYDPQNQTPGFNVWDKQSQMGGAYDPSGKFRGSLNLKQEIDPMDLFGIAMVAAPFAAALGGVGATAAGTAGGAGGTAAGAAAGTGISYTASGAPIFGVVDTSIPFGTGISYTAGGAPVFGVVDTGAAEAAKAAAAAGAGGAGGAGAGGGGGGGGGAGSGAGASVSKAASQLGLSKVVDKLGGSLLSAGVSSVVGSLMKPDTPTPPSFETALPRTAETKTKAVSAMPDPLAQQRAKKRSVIEQLGRRGRASTVLTNSGRLGG